MAQTRIQEFIERLHRFPPVLRKTIGVSLIICGILGFLPILGFWMIPIGLIVLSADYRFARYLYVNARLIKRRLQRKKRPAGADS